MTDTSHADAGSDGRASSPPARPLRRSKDDRLGVGVAGGLGKFFGIDPIIFRVLFVAMTFMGLTGLVAYIVCYAVIPEEGAANSKLDRMIARMRQRNVPLWVIVALALFIGWVFLLSWWSPVPFTAVAVIAAVIGLGLMKVHRSAGPPTAPMPTTPMPTAPMPGSDPWAAAARDENATVSLTKPGSIDPTAAPGDSGPSGSSSSSTSGGPSERPDSGEDVLPTASEQLRAWWGETQKSSASSGRRGWVTEAVAYALLGSVWLTLGLVSLGTPIPVQAFLWTGFGIIVGCMLIGALLRRPRWRMLVGVLFITGLIIVIGNYPMRIGDPTGHQLNRPAEVSQIKDTYRMLGGEQQLDLSNVEFSGRSIDVHVTQGAGHIEVTVPSDVDVVLDARVRYGEIKAFDGQTEGVHNHREETSLGEDGDGGGTLRLTIDLLAGQVELQRD